MHYNTVFPNLITCVLPQANVLDWMIIPAYNLFVLCTSKNLNVQVPGLFRGMYTFQTDKSYGYVSL